MPATRSVAGREGKRTDDETMASSPDTNPTIVADPADPQTLTPVTTMSASDILLKTNVEE
jgi:hypothetical protein